MNLAQRVDSYKILAGSNSALIESTTACFEDTQDPLFQNVLLMLKDKTGYLEFVNAMISFYMDSIYAVNRELTVAGSETYHDFMDLYLSRLKKELIFHQHYIENLGVCKSCLRGDRNHLNVEQ